MNRQIQKPSLLVLYAVTLTGITTNTLIVASTPEIVAEFGKGELARSLIIAAGSAPGIFLAPFLGLLADKYGRRRILLPSLVVFGLGGLAGSVAPTFEVLMLTRLVVGLGGASLLGLVITVIADYWDGSERIRFIGYNSAVLSIGLTVMPAVGGVIAEFSSWRFAMLPMSFGLVAALVVFRGLPSDRPMTESNIGYAVQLRGLGVVFAHRNLLLSMGLAFIAFYSIFGVLVTVLPELLRDSYGMSELQRSAVFAVSAMASAIVASRLNSLRALFGAKNILLMSCLLFGLGYGLVGTEIATFLLIAALIYGASEGLAIPTLQELIATNAPDEARAGVLSVYTSVVRSGQTLGALSFGFGLSYFSPANLFNLAGGFYLALLVIYSVGRALTVFRRRRAAGGG